MYWTGKALDLWLEANRPDLARYEDEGRKGFYQKSLGPAFSFHFCGKHWRDVAVALEAEEPPHRSWTAPDTSIWLGEKRRRWLAENGGIQPVIHQLVDKAISLS